MSYKLIFSDKAVFEMEDAFEYYEQKSVGLGKKFLNVLQHYFDKIELSTQHFSAKRSYIREAFIRKFPFVIVYEIHGDSIVVYSVFHTSRNPKSK